MHVLLALTNLFVPFCAMCVGLPSYVRQICLPCQNPCHVTRPQFPSCALCSFVFPTACNPLFPPPPSSLLSVCAHSSDPYVVVQLGDQRHKSSTIEKSLNPTWNEGELPVCAEPKRGRQRG